MRIRFTNFEPAICFFLQRFQERFHFPIAGTMDGEHTFSVWCFFHTDVVVEVPSYFFHTPVVDIRQFLDFLGF